MTRLGLVCYECYTTVLSVVTQGSSQKRCVTTTLKRLCSRPCHVGITFFSSLRGKHRKKDGGRGTEVRTPLPPPPIPLDACNTGCLFTVKGFRIRDVNHAKIHSVNIKKKKKTVPRALLNSYKVKINKEVLSATMIFHLFFNKKDLDSMPSRYWCMRMFPDYQAALLNQNSNDISIPFDRTCFFLEFRWKLNLWLSMPRLETSSQFIRSFFLGGGGGDAFCIRNVVDRIM